MDQRVLLENPYDISADVYAMALVFFCIFKGKSIYDNCTEVDEIKDMQRNIHANYDQIMG